jgi:hypothetical protein
MVLWDHQSEIVDAILERDKVLVIKARQLGVSWVIALIALWWLLAKPGQTVVLISIGEREAISLMDKVRSLYLSLPASIRRDFPVVDDQQMLFSIDHSSGKSKAMSLPSSSTAGRGETIHLLIGDERPAWPKADDQEASLFPAAADSGRILLVGTGNGMDAIYDRWMASPENGWHPIFVGALARPGRTIEWVREQREALGDLGPQEFPLDISEAFLASGRCAFDRESLDLLLRHSVMPDMFRGFIDSEKVDGRKRLVFVSRTPAPWRVWEWPRADREYVIAGDVAGGRADGDFSAAVVYDTTSWDQVAAFHDRIEPALFARELVKAGHLYNRALLVPEANNHGQAVVALLLGWKYPNLYHHRAVDKRSSKAERRPGWSTTEQSRVTLVHALEKAVAEGTIGIRDKRAIAEMHRFIYRETQRGGRFEADSGAHDDLVIAHGIAAAVLGMGSAAKPKGTPIEQPQMPDTVTGYAPV